MNLRQPGILVVDDDFYVLDFLVFALRAKGYRVWRAESGKRAAQVLSENIVEIDLVLCDVKMPEQTGPELIPVLQEIHPNFRCIFMTGGDMGEHTSQDLLRSGAQAILLKPFSIARLLEVIETVT